MNKRVKFLGLDVLYSIVLVIVAVACSLIQCIGITPDLPAGLIDFELINVKYNYFAYFAGALLYAGFLFYSFKKFLKTKYSDYPIRSAGVVIMHFMISAVFCFIMFIGLIFASLMLIGYDISLNPELLLFITVFIWPIVSFVLMNAALVIFLIRTKNETVVPKDDEEDDQNTGNNNKDKNKKK